jgi:hypothetical protein
MDAGRSANFHALIGSLYDAALDPREWQAIPVRLARFFEAGSSTLWLWPKRAGALEGLETFGWTKQELDTYRDHYAERDIWSIEGVKQPMRSALLMSEVVPSAVFAESEFYRDLGRHLGLFYCMGTALSVDDRQLCILGLHIARASGRTSPVPISACWRCSSRILNGPCSSATAWKASGRRAASALPP